MSDERSRGDGAAPLEWVAAVVSALIVLGAAGFLVHEGLTEPGTPPRVTLTVDSVVAAGGGFLVEFQARNDGGRTAGGLTVEGEVRAGGETETSEVTIDYLPAEGVQRGGLYFTLDPRSGELRLRPRGYKRP